MDLTLSYKLQGPKNYPDVATPLKTKKLMNARVPAALNRPETLANKLIRFGVSLPPTTGSGPASKYINEL